MSAVEMAENPYSRLVWWEVWNFMSIGHARCEFDEKNIINLKGYNDSGKSAMMQALKVLMFNSNATKQAGFIKDDTEFFRVLACFDDGVQILRDKYINGQSLYEMYKDGQCIYSSKSGNVLAKITAVPDPIADYLGLVSYENACLNARACFEKQIGVDTTGSENYKMFNVVLKSEEIAVASGLLNSDRNRLSADINATDSELQAQKSLLGIGDKITDSMLAFLKQHDSFLDKTISMTSELEHMRNLNDSISALPCVPEIPVVECGQLERLLNLQTSREELEGIQITPELPLVDDSQLISLRNLSNIFDEVSKTVIAPEVPEMNSTQLENLITLNNILNSCREVEADIIEGDANIKLISNELELVQKELESHGVAMVRCPDCGSVFSADEAHLH